jgi:hypothetical protein
LSRKNERAVDVTITLNELRAVVKSLSIGVDQLAKKLQRLTGHVISDSLYQEYLWLSEAKKEFESVLIETLKGE